MFPTFSRLRSLRATLQRPLYIVLPLLLLLPAGVWAAGTGIPAITMNDNPGGGTDYSVSLQVLILMTMLSFLPAIVIMMTSFTRIIVVLSILRQAIGLQQSPSNQILIGITLFMTL
ncbi:MAG: flagellar type III secretion system pore protein FliP, partial [Plesiomonas shigelloides]